VVRLQFDESAAIQDRKNPPSFDLSFRKSSAKVKAPWRSEHRSDACSPFIPGTETSMPHDFNSLRIGASRACAWTLALFILSAASYDAQAAGPLPDGGRFVAGAGTIRVNGNTLTVTQSTNAE
jgi:hypothetical protein